MSSSRFHPFDGKISKHFSNQAHLNPEDAYLSYYDIRLTKEDVDTLHDDWLTDNTIAFWEEYLEREHLTKYANARIVLLRPSMCMMIKHTPDPMSLKDALPDFKATTHVFLPINDCNDSEAAEGGTHWSLLVVSKKDGFAFHYDSLAGMNETDALKVTEKLSVLLDKRLAFRGLEDSPQQSNHSDCGVFVCMEMEHLLLKRILSVSSDKAVKMSFDNKDINPAAGRQKMLKRIREQRKEGQRRRS